MKIVRSQNQQKILLAEISKRAKEIHADAYPMSIGELMSIYRDKELDIHPEFQRVFRWTPLQKTKFIESILLGIPIPSIFVSQRDDGIWDVVDGVQRLSTIFQFTGILRDEENEPIASNKLLGTDYLPSLEGMSWEDKDSPKYSFPDSLRVDFKRQKLDIKIVKKESDPNTKYDLFERLNTLGSHLSDQEMRNCLLVMINPSFHTWLESLANEESFIDTTSLSEKLVDEKYNMELVLRFLVFSYAENKELRGIGDVGDFITKRMRAMAMDPKYDMKRAGSAFKMTFDALNEALGADCFRRSDGQKGRGGFLISVFEVVGVGLGSNIVRSKKPKPNIADIKKAISKLWNDPTFENYSRSGRSATSRIPKLIPLGRSLFDVV